MIKKAVTIGLITLSLALAGCTNKSVDDNKQSNPGVDKNTTTGDEEPTEE